jgi:hypothetical protein
LTVFRYDLGPFGGPLRWFEGAEGEGVQVDEFSFAVGVADVDFAFAGEEKAALVVDIGPLGVCSPVLLSAIRGRLA